MKRLRVVLLLAGFALVAPVVHAQTGMNLAWNNCITQSNAAEDKSYACDGSTNGTPFKLVLSFFTAVVCPSLLASRQRLKCTPERRCYPIGGA